MKSLIKKPINQASKHAAPRYLHSKCLGAVVSMFTFISLGSLPAQAVDRFTLTLGTKEQWDSNFARSAEVDSEHYTHSTAALQLNQRLSKQQFSLGLSGNDYRHAQRDDLDVSFYEGNASWRSDWSARVKTAVAWERDAYAVDRLEFADKDVVARDNFTGQLSYTGTKKIGFTLGARQITQTHSNDLREYLDYDDEEGFAAVTYTTANNSSLSFRVREGERIYQASAPEDMPALDFEYRQLELEGSWALTRKTQLGFTLGRFDRDGQINSGTGTLALIDLDWAMTEKLKLSLNYSQSEPAIGETSDSPSDIRSGKVSLAWEPSAKWSFSMSAGYSELAYLQRDAEPAREENITSFSPFALTYRFSDKLRIRLDSHWVDRESPLLYRDYDYATASFGATLVF